jgi:hypothetical protein
VAEEEKGSAIGHARKSLCAASAGAEEEMRPRRPLSLNIAAYAAGCAFALLLYAAADDAIRQYNESKQESLRLGRELDRLANCCLDTTFVAVAVHHTFSRPPGPIFIRTSTTIKRPSGYVPPKVSAEVSADTTQWYTISDALNSVDYTQYKKPIGAKYLRLRVTNNP